jgi:hypothetical protein
MRSGGGGRGGDEVTGGDKVTGGVEIGGALAEVASRLVAELTSRLDRRRVGGGELAARWWRRRLGAFQRRGIQRRGSWRREGLWACGGVRTHGRGGRTHAGPDESTNGFFLHFILFSSRDM